MFQAHRHLISVDGGDGTGKSTITKLLAIAIEKKFQIATKLIKPTYFSTCPESQQIGDLLNQSKGLVNHSLEHNRFFLNAMRVNYSNVVIPLLESGNIVLLDSSDLRALAFILDNGDKYSIQDTKDQIENGYLTCGIQPKLRFLISLSASDVMDNLLTKDVLDKGDPRDVAGVIRRMDFYQIAANFFKGIHEFETVQFVEIQRTRVSNEFLEQSMEEIINDLILPEIQKIL